MTALLKARKFVRDTVTPSTLSPLQCDRAFEGAEVTALNIGPGLPGMLQCDRAFEGAEVVQANDEICYRALLQCDRAFEGAEVIFRHGVHGWKIRFNVTALLKARKYVRIYRREVRFVHASM